MTRPGSLKGAWVLSARFLDWARNKGAGNIIEDVADLRTEYRTSGAATSRYGDLTDKELEEARSKALTRLNRIESEAGRRGDQSGGGQGEGP